MNRPNRICVSSLNKSSSNTVFDSTYQSAFSSFNVSLRTPCSGIRSLALTSAIIPQCGQSFSNSELVFFYYKLATIQTIDGLTKYELPSTQNLKVVRLLPSYYKKELILNPQLYGFNRLFIDYPDLLLELNKSCINDLAYTNDPSHQFPFEPSDITFLYDAETQLFSMKGNNVSTQNIFTAWDNSKIYYPNDTASVSGINYICINQSLDDNPETQTSYWSLYTSTLWNTYLVAGNTDPNTSALYPLIEQLSYLHDFDIVRSILPQPYNLINKNLNMRLGFTWTGSNTLQNAVINPNVYTLGSDTPLILNRLRPIPLYESTPSLLAELHTGLSTSVFTADSNANLVYSNIIFVYSNISGTSISNSMNDLSLLAVIPVNVESLGVIIYQSTTEYELQDITRDIYGLSLYFRTEINEPYAFGNNANISCEIKLSR